MIEDPGLDLFAEESFGMEDLAAEELQAGNAYSTWACLSSFTSASCPASTFATVGSFSSA